MKLDSLKCLCITTVCWVTVAVSGSKITERLDAIEHLVRGEMYFIRKDIQADREEREQFMKQLNKTLEMIVETGVVEKAIKTHGQVENQVDKSDIEKLTQKVGQNSAAIEEIADAILRNRRGIMEEKQARKSEVIDIISQMKNLQQNQNEVIKNKNIILQRLSEIMSNQNQSMNGQAELKAQIKTIMRQTTDIQDAFESLNNKTDSVKNILEGQQDELNLCIENVVTTASTTLTTETTMLTTEETQMMTTTPVIPDGTIRLVGGSNEYEGRVEIMYKGQYGTVCDNYWDDREAKVVCRMMGLAGGTGYIGLGSDAGDVPQHDFGSGTGEILLDSVGCNEDEESLFLCRHSAIGFHNCDHRKDAGVKCEASAAVETIMTMTPIPPVIPNVTIRLVGGSDQYEGRVEIMYSGQYGTVCDDYWNDLEAKVVCKMMGLTGGTGYHGRGSPPYDGPQHDFGSGTGVILLDWVGCIGDEESLFFCRHRAIGDHDCNHSEDAGVKCDP